MLTVRVYGGLASVGWMDWVELRVCEVGMFCWINLGGVEVAASV